MIYRFFLLLCLGLLALVWAVQRYAPVTATFVTTAVEQPTETLAQSTAPLAEPTAEPTPTLAPMPVIRPSDELVPETALSNWAASSDDASTRAPLQTYKPTAPPPRPTATLPLPTPTRVRPTTTPTRRPVTPTAVPTARPTASVLSDPVLLNLIARVKNGVPSQVVGVYSMYTLALRVVQQPAANPVYVSDQMGIATQYGAAARRGTIGLLAHNGLSGASFDKLPVGSAIWLVYGDGSTRRYIVSNLRRFQAVSPVDPASDLIDLATGARLSSSTAFEQVYATGSKLVLQTCIQYGAEWSWGRLFVTAIPR